jgi:hypothetical protein
MPHENALRLLLEDTMCSRSAIPRFEALRGQSVTLVLGFCPKRECKISKTNKIINSLFAGGEHPSASWICEMNVVAYQMILDAIPENRKNSLTL